mmetsp:Transcript_5574/g.14093  ORF Transcript_5574/g.14093 Transcript_5574/m.14093 type:complete len:310 (-) Transcript_5574:120-1049(-)|eukprot:CAMPEP_0177634458 /NCGR_PEP_ID=MMETSP0447-20121125/3379_1 /TAXON_ID=0 /ORGANISM="Stygamoeba regulata, Strain BSH-02190019" /LENGTH=309 /DNA_ID=CAMNT_0019136181 /DNA_START=202 /DNA_END=1131 /DNA_ORIENTATION=-
MDCAVVPLAVQAGLTLIQTTDFFYPLVDDPYIQGKIACANVLSDLYAMGVPDCDNMLMLLAASRAMPPEYRYICARKFIQGFSDLATAAGTNVTGGQTVLNPWPLLGGVATAVVRDGGFIHPSNGVAGDAVVLTKPLGTQVAVNLHQWAIDPVRWEGVKGAVTQEQAEDAYRAAETSMARLNRNGAVLMRKYGAHGATDVTGFGLIGHADNLAQNQSAPVDIELHTLPIISKMAAVDTAVGGMFGLLAGRSAETSGGLLVMLPAECAQDFCREIETLDGFPAWVVGRVVDRAGNTNAARLVENLTIVEV